METRPGSMTYAEFAELVFKPGTRLSRNEGPSIEQVPSAENGWMWKFRRPAARPDYVVGEGYVEVDRGC